jgi:hypothetical protein
MLRANRLQRVFQLVLARNALLAVRLALDLVGGLVTVLDRHLPKDLVGSGRRLGILGKAGGEIHQLAVRKFGGCHAH